MGNKQSIKAQSEGVRRDFMRYRLSFVLSINVTGEASGKSSSFAKAKAAIRDPLTWQAYLEETMLGAICRELGSSLGGSSIGLCYSIRVVLTKKWQDDNPMSYIGYVEWMSVKCDLDMVGEALMNSFGDILYYYGISSLDSKWKIVMNPKGLTGNVIHPTERITIRERA